MLTAATELYYNSVTAAQILKPRNFEGDFCWAKSLAPAGMTVFACVFREL